MQKFLSIALSAFLMAVIPGFAFGKFQDVSPMPTYYEQLNFLPKDEARFSAYPRFAMSPTAQSAGGFADPLTILATSYATPKNIYVVSIRCIRPTSGSDEDDVRLEAYDSSGSGERRDYSRVFKMKADSLLGPKFGTHLKTGSIWLVEVDSFSADDEIGSIKFDETIGAGRYVQKMAGDGGVYEVTFEVRPYHSIEQGGMGKTLD
jgi:hypothetical protein